MQFRFLKNLIIASSYCEKIDVAMIINEEFRRSDTNQMIRGENIGPA
jgi:hypothetical protein